MSRRPGPPTLDELRAMPVTLNFPQACAALGFSVAHGYKLLAEGAFPIDTQRHVRSGKGRSGKRSYALADVIRYHGFDPAMVAPPSVPKADAA